MIEFFLRSENGGRCFIPHFDEVADRQVRESAGISFAARKIFRKSAFAIGAEFFKAFIEDNAIFEGGIHSLTVKWNHCVGCVAEQANPVTIIPWPATNGHQ